MENKQVKSKKKTKRNVNPVHVVLNSVIAALILIIFLFVYSLYDNHLRIESNYAAYTGSDLENIPTAMLTDQERKKEEVNLIVQVLNGCGVSGIAAQFQGILNERGVDVIDVGNAGSQEYDYSTIYFYDNGLDKAFRLADMLGIEKTRIFEKEHTSLGNDLTLVLGSDYAHLNKITLHKEEMKMQILNGCGVNGISRRYQTWFERQGYQVIDVRNANNFKYYKTLIQYDNSTLREDIMLMKNNLGLQEDQIKKVSDLGKANVSIILGHDYAWLNPYTQLRSN